jgi:Ca2+-binding EF-hand superfamily protein
MGAMMEAFDADGDGTTTPDELRAGLQAQLAEFDADGDGTLSLDEFESLHAAMTREMTVDRFQELDNDGDGQVTADEITAPADRMERMQARRDQMLQQAPGRMPMQDMDDGMMDNDAPADE